MPSAEAPGPGIVGPMWLVGCGGMGGALLDRWLGCGLPPEAVTVIDPAPRMPPTDPAVRIVAHPPAKAPPRVLVLAVKPQSLGQVAPGLAPYLGVGTLVISILAGATTASVRTTLGARRIVRAMPNTPARVGCGVTALFADGASPDDVAIADRLMRQAGDVHWIDDEGLFDAVTAVSGSGPAYVFRFVEALAMAGVTAGLPEPLAKQLALGTLKGAAALLSPGDATPEELRKQVTSPNGTTEAGLTALDGSGKLTALLEATVQAAATRSRELKHFLVR